MKLPQRFDTFLSCISAMADYPLTAPAVSPLTIWRWKKRTRMKSGTVADTTAVL